MVEQLTRYEELSRELNQLRERRIAERRQVVRDGVDRRISIDGDARRAIMIGHHADSSNQTP